MRLYRLRTIVLSVASFVTALAFTIGIISRH